MPKLRAEARRAYLAKREDDRVAALEAELADEAALFAGEALTPAEAADVAYKRRVVELARAQRAARGAVESAGTGYRVPTAAAVDVIAELEGDRGFYAGAVGWCDARGDGRWVVAIRGAQLSADRRTALASAGGGIVAESDADNEVEETTAKFGTILRALGVP